VRILAGSGTGLLHPAEVTDSADSVARDASLVAHRRNRTVINRHSRPIALADATRT
jgi:hypothetical protein